MKVSRDLAPSADAPGPKVLPQRGRRFVLVLILGGYLLVTLLYGIVNPLFEAPDEHWHYFTTQYIAENKRLPIVAPGDAYDKLLGQEAAQPPLYYVLGSMFIKPIDTTSAREEIWPNKFRSTGDAGELMNLNQFVHGPLETWPWRGYALAAHILRGFSTILGLGTLLLIYSSGRLLWPADAARALLAMSLVAFLPQYNFLHAAVTNDALVIFLVSGTLFQLIRLWQSPTTWARLLLLGITIGLSMLSKNVGITLLIYSAGMLVLLAIRSASMTQENRPSLSGWRLVAASLILTILPAILLTGWLWARNWSLYGDLTATNQFIRLAGGDRDYSFWTVLLETRGLWLSLYAVFGWFNIRPPQWVYYFWNGLVVLALAGAGWRALKKSRGRDFAQPTLQESARHWSRIVNLLNQDWFLMFLLAMWVVSVYASLLYFMLQTEAAQGRLLFPALLPLALGMASGLTATVRLQRVSPVFPLIAFFISLYCLFFVVRPAYATPPVVGELATAAREMGVEVADGIRLLGVSIDTTSTVPGDPVWLTIYWQGDGTQAAAPELVLSAFGRDGQEIGKVHSYHGRGLYPAGLWPADSIIADRTGFRIDQNAEAPVLAQIDVTILDAHTVRVGEHKITSAEWPNPTEEILAQFGPAVDLVASQVSPAQAHPGDLIYIDVRWQVRMRPETDYTTLIHLGQPDQTPLATGDRPPLDGRYPTTVWESGEQFDDHYELLLPQGLSAGRYPVWIGMYDSQTLDRLPVVIDQEAQPRNIYLAGWVDVE